MIGDLQSGSKGGRALAIIEITFNCGLFIRCGIFAGDLERIAGHEQQIHEELEFYREEFPMIVDDVSAMPTSIPIFVEGAALLPEKVEQLVSSPHHAIWIVPVPDFQKEHYAKREWIHDILKQCDDPDSAFKNWMGRDIGFAAYVAKDAMDRGFKVIFVDGSRSIQENYEEVKRHFNL